MKFFKNLILLLVAIVVWPSLTYASQSNGTIDIENKYAWGDEIGWVNFGDTNGSVTITDSGITGYAWVTNFGWINLSPDNSGVANDGEGDLSGKAWGESTGWMDFEDISISNAGVFSGTATTDAVGSIIFDCDNCYVATDWRPISVRSGGGGSVGVSSPRRDDRPDEKEFLLGDLDRDGDVDIFDFNILIINWDSDLCDNAADIDENCLVDIFDFNILIVHWSV